MQFVKGKPPETQYATRPGARAKRREVALGRPGCIHATLFMQDILCEIPHQRHMSEFSHAGA
jgi:hypothetical protein